MKRLSWNEVLVLMLAVAALVSAPQHLDYTDPAIYEQAETYELQENYGNSDFLQNSDPSQWRLDLVDWSNPAVWQNGNIDNLLVRNDFYDTFNQQGNYNTIPESVYGQPAFDHTKVDGEKFLHDLGCECTISASSLVRYSALGLRHVNPNVLVSVPGTYPSGTSFITMEDNIEVVLPEGTDFTTIPAEDYVLVRITEITIEGATTDVTFNSGRLLMDHGRMIIARNQRLQVNGITISSTVNAPLYLDGLEHQDNDYLSLSPDDLIAKSTDRMIISFDKTNGLLEFRPTTKKEEVPDVEFDPRLGFLIKNGELRIEDRTGIRHSRIPKATFDGEKIVVVNNGNQLSFKDNRLRYQPATQPPRDAVALQVDINNLELIESGQSTPQYLLFDNYGNFALASDMEVDVLNRPDDDITISQGFVSDYLKEKAKLEGVDLSGRNFKIMATTYSQLKLLPESVRNSVKEINFLSLEEFASECGGGDGRTNGCSSGSKIYFPESVLHIPLGTLYHEAAHAHMDGFRVSGDYRDFVLDWEKVAGNIYGKNLDYSIVSESEKLADAWSDGTNGPRNGCIRPYGCNRLHEDVATFVEPIALRNYRFFYELITPTSPRYDPRYQKKLDLLVKYGFITQEDYEKVVKSKH